MFQKIRAFISRYPDRERMMRSLAGSNETAKDLLLEHHNLSVKIDNDARDSWERLELRRRRLDLEEQLLRMSADNMRV